MNFKKALSCMGQTGAIERFHKYSKAIKPEHFHRPHGIHGINHTKRVLFFVELLASLENLDESERDILSIAAVYHDIGRTNDGVDPGHGYASFMKANDMDLIKIDIPEDYNAVKYLIETHCINDNEL